jgi:predicted DNA-binding protein with PD1-like motif
MREWEAMTDGRIVFLSFERGEDYVRGLETALARRGIRSAVVLSTVATFARCHLHMAQGLEDVNDLKILDLEGPVEVTAISGIVSDGQAHLHASVADRDGRGYGGHLEPDCPVLYLAEVALLAVDAPTMTRQPGTDGVAGLRG